MNEVEAYIRQDAIARGLDPDYEVRVAQAEGGLDNPYQHGLGAAPASQDPALGKTENSYGPFQLYVSGNNAGLGDAALAAGVDPRTNWKAGVDFALDTIKKVGHGQWYGARKIGLPANDPSFQAAAGAPNKMALTRHPMPTQEQQAQTNSLVQTEEPPAAPAADSKDQLMKMMMAASLANIRLQPVEYDPFAVMPHF